MGGVWKNNVKRGLGDLLFNLQLMHKELLTKDKCMCVCVGMRAYVATRVCVLISVMTEGTCVFVCLCCCCCCCIVLGSVRKGSFLPWRAGTMSQLMSPFEYKGLHYFH